MRRGFNLIHRDRVNLKIMNTQKLNFQLIYEYLNGFYTDLISNIRFLCNKNYSTVRILARQFQTPTFMLSRVDQVRESRACPVTWCWDSIPACFFAKGCNPVRLKSFSVMPEHFISLYEITCTACKLINTLAFPNIRILYESYPSASVFH